MKVTNRKRLSGPKTKRVGVGLIGVGLLATAYLLINWVGALGDTEPSLHQQLMLGLVAKKDEENNHLPKMLDKSTRLDRVDSNGLEYIYFLSVVGAAAERFKSDVKTGRIEDTHQSAKWSICESQEMAALLQAGVRLTYRYSVSDFPNMVAVTVDKSDCV